MSAQYTSAELWEGAGVVCRRLGLRKVHILTDDGRPLATYQMRPGILPKIDRPRYVPGEPAVSVGLVLACRRRGRR